MNIAIVDDDSHFSDEVEEIVLSYHHYETYKFKTSKDFLQSEELFDLIFVGIDTPDTAEISLSDQLRNRNTPVIFVSNHDDHKDHLKKELYGYLKHVKCEEIGSIPFNEITYITKEHKVLEVHSNDGAIHHVKETKHLNDSLGDRFVKINHTTVISKDYLESVKESSAYVNGEELHIGHHHLKELQKLAKKKALS